MIIIHTLKPDNPYIHQDDVGEPEDHLELEEKLTVIIYYGGYTGEPIEFNDDPRVVSKDDPTQWAEGW